MEFTKYTMNGIIRIACDVMGLEVEAFKSLSRDGDIPLTKQMVAKYIHENLKVKKVDLQNLMEEEGVVGFNHSTILYGVKIATNRIDTEIKVRRAWDVFIRRADVFMAGMLTLDTRKKVTTQTAIILKRIKSQKRTFSSMGRY